jgi:DNA modification methylase
MSELLLGDCLEVMRTLPDCSVDAVVTDPPYGLAFMGKRWDYDVPSVEIWAECLRVLKPGGHLLAFAGTRTQHRMAVRIEDAGFEIRDLIAWVYGSGFPKSLDVSKAIDKCNGETGRLLKFTEWMRTTGLTARQIDKITETNMGGHYLTAASQPAIPTPALWALLRPHCGDVPEWVDQLVQRIEAEREVIGTKKAIPGVAFATTGPSELAITAPATPEAQQWQGWGTALKPALEPITVARKPLVGTVAANVLAHGTGGINVDGCRVGWAGEVDKASGRPASYSKAHNGIDGQAFKIADRSHRDPIAEQSTLGRWPANLIHDGSDEVVGLFPQATAAKVGNRGAGKGATGCYGVYGGDPGFRCHDDNGGSAARFFYTAKASRDDRSDGNTHPTVKPTDLMRYLCRLVTPPGGVVLDPFMGSGSTGKAAMLEGFEFIGIEREVQYHAIAERRIRSAAATGHQPSLPL